MKTTREIVEESFKNQDFNQKQSYKDITTVFDTLEWIEEPTDKWFSESEVLEIFYNDEQIKEWFNITLNEKLEQLQKELKEELRCNLPSNFDCDKESERIVDEVFNKFKVKA